MSDKTYLIKNLLDKNVDLGLRDDCAMDLSAFNDEEALAALYNCASDPRENSMIQSSCGESLAEIMLRNSSLDERFILGLSTAAKAEIKGIWKVKHPDWIEKLEQ